MMRRAPRAVTGYSFPVILKIVRVTGHDNLNAVLRQKVIDIGQFVFVSCGVMAARKARMADNGHGELAAAAFECAFDPCLLSIVHGALNAGIDGKKREIIRLELEKGARCVPYRRRMRIAGVLLSS